MAKFLPVKGRILSRDSYREDRWDPEKKETVQSCIQAARVEYTVNGKIYTHSFSGADIGGKVGEACELLYQADAPETVKPAVSTRKHRPPVLSFLQKVF